MGTLTSNLSFHFLLLSIFLFPYSEPLKFRQVLPAALHRRSKLQLSPNSSNNIVYDTKYFTQTLDHFNYYPASNSTFQQKYLVDDRHWAGPAKAAPIFVYTGNEGDIEWFTANTGFMFDVAPYFNALLVFIEHRYYGESMPFGDKEVAYKNASTFGFLSTAQALADFATLIIDLKKNLTAERSPVVVFGGSYGGMLAAWFRLKYPHVTIGALSSSAPILMFEDIISPYTFYNTITNDFRSESENCYKVIKNSWDELDNAGGQKGGMEKLANSFKICKEIPRDESLVGSIIGWIQEALIYCAMTDYPTESNFLTPLPAYPVKKMCEAIDNPTTGNDTYARLYGAMNIYYNHTGNATCFNPNKYENDALGATAWDWQASTEMILQTDGSNEESIFPPYPYNYTGQPYLNAYGVMSRPNWITTEFGGHDIKRVLKTFGSNIIFFNGLRDPWSGGGVLESLSKSLIAILAPKGAHHVDLRFATDEDPKWLQKLRKREIRIISSWLHEYYNDSEFQ